MIWGAYWLYFSIVNRSSQFSSCRYAFLARPGILPDLESYAYQSIFSLISNYLNRFSILNIICPWSWTWGFNYLRSLLWSKWESHIILLRLELIPTWSRYYWWFRFWSTTSKNCRSIWSCWFNLISSWPRNFIRFWLRWFWCHCRNRCRSYYIFICWFVRTRTRNPIRLLGRSFRCHCCLKSLPYSCFLLIWARTRYFHVFLKRSSFRHSNRNIRDSNIWESR